MRFDFAIRSDFSRLCSVMLRGEMLALRCCRRQAQLSRDGLRRQLQAQHRHEHLHVTMFRSILAALPSRCVSRDRPIQLLDAYERKLDDAIDRGDLLESLLGLQVVLEGAAAATLYKLDLSVGSGNAPLDPARCLLVAQEDGHQLIGERVLASALQHGDVADRLQRASVEYTHMVREIFASCRDALGTFGVEPVVDDASDTLRRMAASHAAGRAISQDADPPLWRSKPSDGSLA